MVVCQYTPQGNFGFAADYATNVQPVSKTAAECGSGATSSGCRTTNSNACVFPFTHAGTSYSECTTADNNGVAWCATGTVSSAGAYTTYGTCDPATGCTVYSTSTSTRSLPSVMVCALVLMALAVLSWCPDGHPQV